MPWFVGLAQRLRPREGWLIFSLAWGAVLCLPAAAVDTKWLVGMEPGFWLATLGFLLAWRLGHMRRLQAAAAVGILVLSGMLADLWWGVSALSFGRLWLSGAEMSRYAVWWLGSRQMPPPALMAAGQQWSELVEFAHRVAWWVEGLAGSRQAVPDILVVAGLALLLIWLASAWLGWYMARKGRPFEALLPAMILIVVQAFVLNRGTTWVLALLSLLPVLMALERSYWLAQRWEAEGTDYSTEIHMTAALAGLAGAILVLFITPILPFLTSRQLADAFWHSFARPYRQVEQRVSQSFPAAEGARSLVPPGGLAAGGLPRAHLLRGRPELGRQVSLRVAVRGAEPNDTLYWRGQTFSVYDGHGWQTDVGTSQLEAREAGQPWSSEQFVGRHTVLSFVDVYAATVSVLYGPGEPVSADRPYTAITRARSELVQLQAPGGPDTYTILSSVPDENPNALRVAGSDYPQEIRDLYLGLPEEITPEVREYAERTGAEAVTPYDVAVALERSLRQIPYSLDVPAPPGDRELVSWFLFDLKRGYCDYYATAMVVLARLRGIPARLAVGYATGDFDREAGRYQVTEQQAHSWPELYFPKIGWVPFEPTAARPELARVPASVPAGLLAGGPLPVAPEPELSELRARGAAYAAEAARRARTGWLLATFCGLLAAWTSWRLLHTGSIVTTDGAGENYWRLTVWGYRLGRPARATETPREYALALVEAAATAAARARLWPADAAKAAQVAKELVPRFTHEFEVAEWGGTQRAMDQSSSEHGTVSGAASPLLADPTERSAGIETTTRGRRDWADRGWEPMWRALRRLWLASRWRV